MQTSLNSGPLPHLLDAAPDAIIVLSPEGLIAFVNAQTEKLFGFQRSELIGVGLDSLIPERLRERHAQHLHRYFSAPTARSMGSGIELVACKKDGTEFPIEVSLGPVPSEHGMFVSAAIRDISARKRIEAETKLNADRFASAIESMHDGFAMYDRDDHLVRCNAAYRRLLEAAHVVPLVGQTRAQLVDTWLGLAELDSAATRAELRASWLSAGRDEPRTFDLKIARGARSLRVTSQPTGHGDLVEVIWDITEDERRNEELRRARAEAEAASAAKSDFLSSMSHELRTPMNAILGFAQLLTRDVKHPLAERHRERVAQILRGGEHLLRLIDEVLDLARLEAGQVSISAEPVGVGDVLAEVVETLQPMASEHGVQLQVATDTTDMPRVVADRGRLVQVLQNYGSNAIKYNRKNGHVVFCVEQREGKLRVLVEDNGIGIPAEQHGKMFQAFERAGQETGPIEGTGIGLLMTKRLAKLMGGDVGFSSEPGHGSTFWIELPHTAAGKRVVQSAERHALIKPLHKAAPSNVVYVEDNPANIAFMRDLFEGFEGVQLMTARSAEEGLTLTRNVLPAVVVMDINLPGMTGTQALAALRQAPETRDIPVIALTAAASERERKHGTDAGFFRYLNKPLVVDELVSAIKAAVER